MRGGGEHIDVQCYCFALSFVVCASPDWVLRRRLQRVLSTPGLLQEVLGGDKSSLGPLTKPRTSAWSEPRSRHMYQGVVLVDVDINKYITSEKREENVMLRRSFRHSRYRCRMAGFSVGVMLGN